MKGKDGKQKVTEELKKEINKKNMGGRERWREIRERKSKGKETSKNK